MKSFNYKNKKNWLMLALFSVLGLNATWNFSSSEKTDLASRFSLTVDKDDVTKGSPDKDLLIMGEIVDQDKDTGIVTVNLKAQYKSAASTTEGGIPLNCKECHDLPNQLIYFDDVKNVTDLTAIKAVVAGLVKRGDMFDETTTTASDDTKDEDEKEKKKADDEKDPILAKNKCGKEFDKDGDTKSVVNNSFLSCAVTQLGILSDKNQKKGNKKYDIFKLYTEYIQPRLQNGMKDKEDSEEREAAENLINEILKDVNSKEKQVRKDVNKLMTAKWKIERDINTKEFKAAKKDENEARSRGDAEALADALQRKNDILLDYANNFQDHYDTYSDAVSGRVDVETGFTNAMAKSFIRDGMGKPFNYDPRYSDAERYGVAPGMVAGWVMSQLNGSGSYNDDRGRGYNERTLRNGLLGTSDRIFSGSQGFSRGLGANGGGHLQLNGSPDFAFRGNNGGSSFFTPQSLGGSNFGNNSNNGARFNTGFNGNSTFDNNFPYSSGSMRNSSFINNGPQPRFGNSQQYNNGGPFMNNMGGPGLNAGRGIGFQSY
jgi:hypothetical protein